MAESCLETDSDHILHLKERKILLMTINKTYAVFGLGRYGKAVATQLVSDGAEVIAVDIDEI